MSALFNRRIILYTLFVLFSQKEPVLVSAVEIPPIVRGIEDNALKAGFVPTVTENLLPRTLETASTSPQDLIRHYSLLYGIDEQLALNIVKCESNFERYAKNKNSSASGYFQFINSTWRETMTEMGYATSTDKFDEKLSIEAGVWLLSQKGGQKHWSESSQCWSKL